MPETVDCARCHRQAAALASTPYPGPVGEQIRAGICADCWGEWQKVEVMVINELRLNFMDPQASQILEQHMLEFLTLSPPGE